MNEEFRDEIEVLKTIYDDCVVVEVVESTESGLSNVLYKDPAGLFLVYADIPTDYPISSPSIDISCHPKLILIKQGALKATVDICQELQGSVCIFNIIESIREHFANATQTTVEEDFDTSGIIELVPTTNITRQVTSHDLNVIHGPITTESKSSFQSHFAVVKSIDDVKLFRSIVYEDKRVARATHNIFAYRFTCPQTGLLHHDCDDDGESAAGSRLAEMIRLMKVDNVAVIVSRWFGGILLGPDRFKFICNSARDLLEEQGLGKSSNEQHHHHGRKNKKK